MKYQKGFAPLLLIILIVVGMSAAGGGYVVYKDKQQETKYKESIRNLQNSQSTTQAETSTQTGTAITQSSPAAEQTISTKTVATNTSVSVNTTNWKVYKSGNFSFEIKYPSQYQIKDNSGGDILLLDITTDWTIKSTVSGFQDTNGKLALVMNKSMQPNSSIIDTCKKYKDAEYLEGPLLKCQEMVINGLTYVEIIQGSGPGSGANRVSVSLQAIKAPYNLMIITIIPDDQKLKDRLQIVESIFGTIKLNHSQSSTPPAPGTTIVDMDQKVKSNFSNVRYPAEVYWDAHNMSYGIAVSGTAGCKTSGSMFTDTASGMAAALDLSKYPSGTQLMCNVGNPGVGQGYAVQANLPSGSYLCVDSSGTFQTISSSIGNNSQCPR